MRQDGDNRKSEKGARIGASLLSDFLLSPSIVLRVPLLAFCAQIAHANATPFVSTAGRVRIHFRIIVQSIANPGVERNLIFVRLLARTNR